MAKFVCSSCGNEFTATDEAVDSGAACPACQQSSRQGITACPTKQMEHSKICGICLSTLEADEKSATCSTCGASYHADCWEENKGCAVYGCSESPHVELRSSVEIPVSFWGQENKPCPSCRREILAAATRCRFCGEPSLQLNRKTPTLSTNELKGKSDFRKSVKPSCGFSFYP